MSLKELFKSNVFQACIIILLYVLYALSGSFSEYLFKYSLNSITAGNFNTYVYWQIMQFVLALFTSLLLPITTVVFTRQTQNYLHKIRQEIMHHYYDKKSDEKVSSMQNRLTANLKILSDDYATPWITILSGILEIVIAIVLLASMNWILILVTAILAVITLLSPKIMEKKTSAATDKVNKKNERLLNTIAHWLGGLQELRRYSAYSRLVQQIHRSSSDYVDASKDSAKLKSVSYLITAFSTSIAQIGMSFIAGIMFLLNMISFGDFAVASGFAFTIFSAIWNITQSLTQVKSTKALREQITDLRKQVPDENKDKVSAYGLKVSGLSVKYDQGETIFYPDFTIKKGQKVLLTGDSGTGKSTLFNVLLGKLKPESGTVTYLDENETIIPEGKARIGNMPQNPVVFPATIKENITMFNENLQDKLQDVVQAVQLQSDLAKMPDGVNTTIDLKSENLSGGQRQKVVLARTEIHEQSFVLMDEVTSAIDQKATEKIIDELLKTDQTILMIAHNFTPELKAKFDQEIKLKSKKGDKVR